MVSLNCFYVNFNLENLKPGNLFENLTYEIYIKTAYDISVYMTKSTSIIKIS